jgi:predicted double-glycine peptidase
MIRTGLVLAAALGIGAALVAGDASAQILLNGPSGPMSMGVVSYRDLPFRTVVRQQYDFSCGSAALATLLRHHYGRDVTEREVFEAMFSTGDQAQIRRVGFSLLDMKRYLETYGIRGDGYRLTLDALAESHSPAVVLVNHDGYRHFVVFKGVDETRVLVGDPALGLKIYSRETFQAMWNGVAFMIRDASDRFNQDGEWRPWASAPIQAAMPPSSLASLTQQLPPQYQITTSFSLTSILSAP